jgi:adenylylsulfate kinase-like enzyme
VAHPRARYFDLTQPPRMHTLLTAEMAANSPRFRRKSSTFVDAIHDLPEKAEMAPAQLYSTESGRLFHSGRIAIATVGLPARGKTHVSVALARYLRWLGVKTRIFHLGDYRRATVGPGKDVPDDYFFVNASASSVLLRQKILKKCREDIYHFLNHENGQIAIYDAVNPLSAGRRSLAKEFAKHDIETLFIESSCDDERIIEENVRSVKISSPDYIGWDPAEAVKHYLARMSAKIPHFETMEEPDLNFIKVGQLFPWWLASTLTDSDDQCGRATGRQQLQFRLSVPPHCILSFKLTHQIQAHLFCQGRSLMSCHSIIG